MTETAFPFDNAPVFQAQWSQFMRTVVTDGVVNTTAGPFGPAGLAALLSTVQGTDLLPFGDTSGLQVKVHPGSAWVQGFFYESDALNALAVASNTSGLNRIDRVVLHADLIGGTITAEVLTGTPAAAPVPPPLTQSGTAWEIPLALVYVPSGLGSVAPVNVVDARLFSGPRRNLWALRESPAAAAASLKPINIGLPIVVPPSGIIKVLLQVSVSGGVAPGDGALVEVAAFRDRTVTDATVSGTTLTSLTAGFSNADVNGYVYDTAGVIPTGSGGNNGRTTQIASVNPTDPTTATLSASATGPASGDTVTIESPLGVVGGLAGVVMAGSPAWEATSGPGGSHQCEVTSVIGQLPPGPLTLVPMAQLLTANIVVAAAGLIVEPY